MTALGQGALTAAQLAANAITGLPITNAVILTEATGTQNPRQVALEQDGPVVPRPPQPRWDTVDMPGSIGVPEYSGQDPYEYTLPVRLDGFPDVSVEDAVTTLHGFAEVQPGDREPAVLKVDGAVPLPHPHLLWRLVAIADPTEQRFLPGGRERCFYVTVLTLRQHVTGADAAASIRQNAGGRPIQVRSTSVRAGEHDLFDVARRVYGDTSRATDIARANPGLQLGGRLKTGQKLRMPV